MTAPLRYLSRASWSWRSIAALLISVSILVGCTTPIRPEPAADVPAFDARGEPAIQLRDIAKKWHLISRTNPESAFRWDPTTRKTTEVHRVALHYDSSKDGTPIRHLYGDILKSPTLTTGILLDACASANRESTPLDMNGLVRKARLLSSCAHVSRDPFRNLSRLLRDARSYYERFGTIPIVVIDVDAQKLSASVRSELEITGKGRFGVPGGSAPFEVVNVFAAAPLRLDIPHRKLKVIVDRRFIITNRQLQDFYSVSIDGGTPIRQRLGQAFAFQFRNDNKPLRMALGFGSTSAGLGRSTEFLFQATIVPRADLTWTPCHVIGPNGEDVYINPYVYYGTNRDPRPSAPQIQRPFVILGGFDQELFGNVYRMYARLSAITPGSDFMTTLRQGFDVVLLEYSDVTHSLVLQAQALACVIKEINVRNQNRDGLVFVGISMGGLVSRLSFAGMENSAIPGISGAHNVKFWATIDSPHQGATIPLSLQLLAHDFRFLPMDELAAVNRLLDSTAAKEMLIEHYASLPTDGTNASTSAPERSSLMQVVNDWGGFPKKIATTVAFASGSLAYLSRWGTPSSGGRVNQNYDYIPGDCPDTGTFGAGCVYIPEQWLPIPQNIQSVQRNTDVMYWPQDNRKGLGGLTILDAPLNIDFSGLSVSVYLRAADRAIQLGNDTSQTSLFTKTWIVNVLPNWALQFFDNPTGTTNRNASPGVPYSLMAGGWEPTAQTIQTGLGTSEFVTVGPTHVTGVTGALAPRHTFVPLWSALDIPRAYLNAIFDWLTKFGPANTRWETWYGSNYLGSGLNSTQFAYENFVDFDTLLWDFVTHVPGVAFSGQVQARVLASGPPDPNTGARPSVTVRPSPFDWVYFNSTNKRHGDLDSAAVQFLLTRIAAALAVTVAPPAAGAGLPPNTAVVAMPMQSAHAPTYLQILIQSVEGLSLSSTQKNQLRTPLQAALQAVNAGDNATAVQQLQNFLSAVQALRGIALSDDQANRYTNEGNDLVALLS